MTGEREVLGCAVGDTEDESFWTEFFRSLPALRKWYRNWAVSRILVETLEDMAPQFPPGEDVEGVVVV